MRVDGPHVRFERLRARDAPRDPESFKTFLQQEQEEEKRFHIDRTIERADLTLKNDASLEALHRAIETEIITDLLAGRCD